MSESTATPVLGVILFTDLVSSTELRSSLGDDAADELRREHDRLHAEAISAHGGALVKGLGDGVMATFPGATEALAAAVAMQRGVARWRRRVEHALSIRVGISAGDVVFEDNDCFGGPVVEAARLCAAAEADQILIADVVRLLAGTRHGFACASVGELELKGLSPISAWDVDWSEPTSAPGSVALPSGLDTEGQFPFVARTAEREVIGRALKTALSSGDARAVLLAGEPGVGKTRLCSEVAREAQREGALVLFGRCDEDLGVPYQPFAEALRWFVSRIPAESRADALGPARGELLRLVPELAALVADIPEPTSADGEVERACLFEAVTAWLRTVTSTQPLVLVLDDLHWAGRPTLQLLRHLMRNCGGALLVLGTYRDTDLSRTHPLSEALADLRREPRVERVRLNGLDTDAVAAFMEAAAGHELGGSEVDLARLIHGETDGNPFFVIEVLIHLGESGAVYQGHDGRWRIRAGELVVPEGVREVVGRRVSRLSEAADSVLATAAVIGTHFSLGVLGAVCELPVEKVEAGLEEAIGAGLVREVRDPKLSYRFSHALVRSTLYEEVSTARRVRLHRQIGEAIEALHAARIEDHVVELAHHFGEAAASGDVAKAVDYCRKASSRAGTQVAFDEAVTWSSRARELAKTAEPPINARVMCEIDIELGDAQRQAGDTAHRETLLAAGRRAAELGTSDLVIRAALLNTRFIYAEYGKVDRQRVEALEAALAVVSDDADRARLTMRLAGELTFSPDTERVLALIDESLALARQSAADDALAWSIQQRMAIMAGPETLDERLRLADELVDLAERPGILDEIGWAAAAGFYPCIESGDVVGAARSVLGLAEFAEKTKRPDVLGPLNARRSTLLTLAGRLDQAEAAADKAREHLAAQGVPETDISWLGLLLPIRVVQGRADELIETARGAFEPVPAVSTWVGYFLWAAGRTDEAAEFLRAEIAKGVKAAVLFHRPWSFAGVSLGLSMPITATPDFAHQLYDLLSPFSGQFTVGPPANPIAAIDHASAACAFAFDDLPRSESHLRSAISLYERMGAPIYAGRSKLMLADLLRRMGRNLETRVLDDEGAADLRSVGLDPTPLSLLNRI